MSTEHNPSSANLLTPAQIEVLDSRGDRKFDAYYISFEPTGNEAIDRILVAIARAGKLYHSTEWWHEEDFAVDGATPADLIQIAANTAAKAVSDAR